MRNTGKADREPSGVLDPRQVDRRLLVENLRVSTTDGAVHVVDGVSLAVRGGQVLGLVGESGCGKTTLSLALLGYTRRGLKVTGGRVLLGGTDILALPHKSLCALRGQEIAYVPQDPASALNPVMRVGRQVEEALKVHPSAPVDRQVRMGEVLVEVGLSGDRDILRRYPHQLSGGQQQRIALAIAFACQPRVIVLDEPTTGLDVTVQRHVLTTIRTMCLAYNVSAVYVTHDLAVVREIAAAVAVMYAGRIVESGPVAEVFESPWHPYTQALIRAVPSPERRTAVDGIEGQAPRPSSRPPGCAFAPRCGLRTLACEREMPPITTLGARSVRCLRAGDETAVARSHPASGPPLVRHTTEPLVLVRNLSAFYGSHQVLSSVGFTVQPEECVAIVGESGAGKTTLAQCVVGLHRQWSGEVIFDGDRVATAAQARTREVLRRTQFVFQNPYLALNPRKTVKQIVADPLAHFFSIRGDDAAQRVAAVLDDVSLSSSYLERYPDELSGGERQRVALARALVVDPDLLVCDEITSALDVSVQAVIVALLRRLQVERKLSIIFITHNLALVRSVARRCVVLSGGRVVEFGRVEVLLESPADPYTKALVADIPRMELGTDRTQPR